MNPLRSLESSEQQIADKTKFPAIGKSSSEAEKYPAFNLPGSMNNPETVYLSPYFDSSYDFPWNPDKLAQNNLYHIYDEMRDDDQIKACVSFKKDMVISAGWNIVCDDEKVKEYIEKNLRETLEEYELGKSFEDVLRDMMSAYEYGFSIAEPIFQINEQNLYEVKTIKVRPPHSFRFNIDRFGNITSITQATDVKDIELDPQKFIHHVYQQEYGNPYGKSDLKAAHTAWAAKKFFTRFYGMYVERFAAPAVIGKYKSTYTADEVNRFFQTLKTLQNSQTFTVPEDTSIEFIHPQRDSTDSYIKGLDMFNTWIARSILVPDLLGISGSKTGGGSYSLGDTQYSLFLTTIEKERKNIARKINMRLITPLVKINFGDVKCKFEFLPMTDDDEVEYSRLWSDFMKSRLVKPSEEEVNHFRRSVKYPEGPVELQEMPTNPLMDDKDQEGDGDAGGKKSPMKGEGKDKSEKKPEIDEKKEKEMSLRMFREKTPYERKFDFTSAKDALNKSQDRFLSKLETNTRPIISDYISQIVDRKIIPNFKPDAINDLTPKYLRDLNVSMKNALKDMYKKFYEDARMEFFSGSKKVFVSDDIFPDEFLKVIDADSFKSVGDYTTLITKKAKDKLMQGIKNGLSQREIIDLIREQMGDASEVWLNTFVRTKTTEMYNTARKNYFETDEIANGIVEAYQWSAILDDRVSDVCDYLDGKIFTRGEFVNRLGPPAHFNCRSVLVPITKYEEYELDDEISIQKLQGLGGNLIL